MSPETDPVRAPLLDELRDLVADRLTRFGRTSALATTEAATAAGRDLGTWLLRQVRGVTGEAAIDLASAVPSRPWTESSGSRLPSLTEPASHAAIIVWTSVLASPLLVRRVFLEDLRRALDDGRSDTVPLSSTARAELNGELERLERGLAKDGVDVHRGLPPALEAVTVSANWTQNELAQDLIEREARYVTDVDGYDLVIDDARSAAESGVLAVLASQAPEVVNEPTASDSATRDRLRTVATALGMSVTRAGRRKSSPARAFGTSTSRTFRDSVRQTRRLRSPSP